MSKEMRVVVYRNRIRTGRFTISILTIDLEKHKIGYST